MKREDDPSRNPGASLPSITDVAREAGVSAMTVSRVLRGERYVRAETARRVEEALGRTGYRSNPMVQALMNNVRRRRVAVRANLAWVEEARKRVEVLRLMKAGARERAEALGFGFEDVVLPAGGLSAERLHGMLRARGVVGVVLAPLRVAGAGLDFPWGEYALATIGRSLAGPMIHHIALHHQHAVERVVAEVAVRGYRRVAYLGRADGDNRSEHLQQMVMLRFNQGLAARRRIEPVLIDGWERGRVGDWLEKCRPDAVVSSYPDLHAMLEALGHEVPGGIGHATLSWRRQYPQVAGIRHPFAALGAGAVDMVLAQIHRNERGVPERPKTMLIEGDWVEGSSLGAR